MRIAIDISGLLTTSGISHYVSNLVNALLRIDRDNDYYLYACYWRDYERRRERIPVFQQPNVHLLINRFPDSLALIADWELGLRLHERFLRARSIDVFHGPANLLPNVRGMKTVLTIHHVGGVMSNPRVWDRYYYGRLSARSIRAADHIVLDSCNSRNDLLSHYRVPLHKASVVYLGNADEAYHRREGKNETLLRNYRIGTPYILFSGPVNERKNLPRAIDAFARIKQKNFPHTLVVTGTIGANYAPILDRKLRSIGALAGDIVFTGRVEREESAWLYAMADMLVYPSLHEGFGFPPLEAMASGCPVIASHVTSILEIVGDAAVLIDPSNTEELAAAIEKVACDRELREEKIGQGFRRVTRFSWEKTARETLEVYRRVYQTTR